MPCFISPGAWGAALSLSFLQRCWPLFPYLLMHVPPRAICHPKVLPFCSPLGPNLPHPCHGVKQGTAVPCVIIHALSVTRLPPFLLGEEAWLLNRFAYHLVTKYKHIQSPLTCFCEKPRTNMSCLYMDLLSLVDGENLLNWTVKWFVILSHYYSCSLKRQLNLSK